MRTWWVSTAVVAFCACHSADKSKSVQPSGPPTVRSSMTVGQPRSTLNRIALTPDGGFCVAGFFEGILDIAGTTFTAKGAGYSKFDGLLACYGADAKPRWGHALSSVGSDYIHDLAIDKSGNIVALGNFGMTDEGTEGITASLAGTTVKPNGRNDSLLASFSLDGKLRWTSVQGSGSFSGRSMALLADSRIVVGGEAYDTVELAGTKLEASRMGAGYVALFAKDGKPIWITAFLARESVSVGKVFAVGDTIYATGYFADELRVGEKTFKSAGGRTDGFVAALGLDGKLRWLQPIGGPGEDVAIGFAADDSDGLIITGLFGETMDIAGTKRTAKGQSDAYLVGLGRDGSPRWFSSFGGTDRDDFRAVAVTPSSIIAVGAISENFKTEEVKELPGVPITVLGAMQGGITGFTRAGAVAWSHAFASPEDLGVLDDVAVRGDKIYAAGTENGTGVIKLLSP